MLLKTSPNDIGPALEVIQKVFSVGEINSEEETARLDRIRKIFRDAMLD